MPKNQQISTNFRIGPYYKCNCSWRCY